MAKKNEVVSAVTEEDVPLDTGGYEGQPVSQFNSFSIWGVNPYATNGQAKNADGVMVSLKQGGFKLPFVQPGVDDPAVLFPIGPEMKMVPSEPFKPYQVYGNTELRDVYIVGATPTYNAVAQSKVIENGRKVTIPKGSWIRVNDSKGEEIKGVTFTEIVLFLVFKDDPTKKVYRLTYSSMSTKNIEAIVNTLGQLAQTYQKLASKKFGKAVGLPAKFAFCVTLGIPDEPLPAGKSFITPAMLKWDNGLPQTYDEIKKYLVDNKTYAELAEIAKEVDEYLASENAPHAVGKLDATFAAKVGVEQLSDGSIVKAGALPPARSQTVAAITSSTSKPEDMTVAQYLRKNTMDDFKALVASLGVANPDDLINVYPSTEQFAEVPGTIKDLVEVYKSTLVE